VEPLALASAAIAILLPYLASIGTGAATKIGEESVETGARLLGWMRARLGGRGQGALDELAADPDNKLNQQDLHTQLAKALLAAPALAEGLKAMLPAAATNSEIMVQDLGGAGAKAAQVKGSGNTTTIG
jgi:hypothetical protein